MSWTDERVETLKRMWAEGQSASQIAKELGGVTRNAVIGKVHRLGLSNRTASETEAEARPETVTPVAGIAEPVMEPSATRAQPNVTEPQPKVEPAAQAELHTTRDRDTAIDAPEIVSAPVIPMRRAVITAGQPLPPQPSANEISPEALANVREVEKTARKLSLMELTERTCKWPIGDPATEEFWFCGLPSVPGKPYCEAHVSVAFQPMSARRDRRR